LLLFNNYFDDPDTKMIYGWVTMLTIIATSVGQMWWLRYARTVEEKVTPPEIPDHSELDNNSEDNASQQSRKRRIIQ
jgi:hypothetical protein